MTRRKLLSRTTCGLVVAAAGPWIRPFSPLFADESPRPLIVRNRRPLDLETPVDAFESWLTPNDLLFVRSHFGVPAVPEAAWRLDVGGMVHRPASFSLEQLAKIGLEIVKIPAVLQCAGNGRAFFAPRIPGVGWERGAVGNAEWAGIRLRDLLERAGVKAEAGHVHFLGADGPPSPKTPSFFRSIPLERALDPSTLLATSMNGAPLPLLHGGPIRLVVPGWAGNHWIKWVRSITVADEEATGFYMQTGYRMPKKPAPPDAVLKPSDLVPVTSMNVKSLITSPAAGKRIPSGRQEIRGVAWTGEGVVSRVDVSVTANRPDQWRPAEFIDEARPYSWLRWRFVFNAQAPGRFTASARATDSNGATQPDVTPWNKSGYLWNGIDRVTFEIT